MSINLSPYLNHIQIGQWLFDKGYLWQMSLLDVSEFSRFSSDRAISFGYNDIYYLWQLGLIRADRIVSSTRLRRVGIEYLGKNNKGQYVYADARIFRQRKDGWVDAALKLRPYPEGVELYFHPFRYHCLYHLDKVLDTHISKVQIFIATQYQKVLDHSLSRISYWSKSEGVTETINKWNDVATLAILTEPYLFGNLYYTLRIPIFMNRTEFDEEISEHWNNISLIYSSVELDTLEELIEALCVDADFLDGNKSIYSILRFTNSEARLKVRGSLGGAILLRSMAEMIRRAAEKSYSVELKEEDERGLGWSIPKSKERLYGSNRIFENNTQISRNYLRRFNLDFDTKVHWYVEGYTEEGALESVFGITGTTKVEIFNLTGEIIQSKSRGKGLSFIDSLKKDRKNKRFSFISIDKDINNKDSEDKIRAIIRAVENDLICGRVFIAEPDFEFHNFDREELEDILWEIAQQSGVSETERSVLHKALSNVISGKGLWERAQRTLLQLTSNHKGKEWGSILMKYAGGNQYKRDGTLRPIIEAIHLANNAANFVDYDEFKKGFRINPSDFTIVKR